MPSPKDENAALAEKVRRAMIRPIQGDFGSWTWGPPASVRELEEAAPALDALLARLAEAERGWSECRRIGSHRAREIEELRKLYKELYAAHAAARSGAR